MKLYSITHRSDIDGMSSSAALVHYFKMPLSNVYFYDFAGLSDELWEKMNALEPSNGMFVITDVGTNNNECPKWKRLLSYLTSRGNRIIWIDHHAWRQDWISALSKHCDIMVIREGRRCATELVLHELCSRDAYSKRLAAFAHVADFNIQTRDRRELLRQHKHAWAIYHVKQRGGGVSNGGLRKIVSQLSKGNFDSAFVDRAYRTYKKTADGKIKVLLSTARVAKVGVLKVAIGFGSGLHATTATRMLEQRFRPKIAIYVNQNPSAQRIHVRSSSRVRNIDSSVIASEFGGGGHPFASAASISAAKYDLATQHGRDRLYRDLIGSITRNYSGIMKAHHNR